MTHCSDDDLVLHYYGELADADEHLAGCRACAERARELGLLLASVTSDVPERGEQYGRDVWSRVQPHLQRPGSGRGANILRSVPVRWALAAAAMIALVASSFVAGRLSMRPSPGLAPTRAASTIADPQLARRVLLLTVAEHLERSDRVLTDVMNAAGGDDISAEQRWADDLIAANRLYRQDALDADEASVASVLDELERALLDIVHRPSDAHDVDLDEIRRRIDSAALLFKVRVMSNELRQQQLGPDAPDRSSTPIS
jgi:hypothetical protein